MRNRASGQSEHQTTPVIYETEPPSYGPHNPSADNSGNHFYTADDRPPVEVLVHNLEHGWTIVWYDESVADDDAQMQVLEATAEKFDQFDSDRPAEFDQFGFDPRYNVIIAPWTKDDGQARGSSPKASTSRSRTGRSTSRFTHHPRVASRSLRSG